jgi:hypothetical protein
MLPSKATEAVADMPTSEAAGQSVLRRRRSRRADKPPSGGVLSALDSEIRQIDADGEPDHDE